MPGWIFDIACGSSGGGCTDVFVVLEFDWENIAVGPWLVVSFLDLDEKLPITRGWGAATRAWYLVWQVGMLSGVMGEGVGMASVT
jgi:hypothetical protein